MKDTSDITSMHVAVYALFLLNGANKRVHTEHIAKKCFEIAKDRFRWQHYDYPDKELVRKALYHASEKKNGQLVTGRSGSSQKGKALDGYQLTPDGAKWITQNEDLFKKEMSVPNADMPKREAERFIKSIKSKKIFIHYLANNSIDGVSHYLFTDMLGCSPDAPKEIIKRLFDRMMTTANVVKSQEMITFLLLCQDNFSDLLEI